MGRVHRIYRCARCRKVFPTEDGLSTHQREKTPCDLCERDPNEVRDWHKGFDQDQAAELKKRLKKRPADGFDDGEKWKRWYRILFPLDQEIPEPCE